MPRVGKKSVAADIAKRFRGMQWLQVCCLKTNCARTVRAHSRAANNTCLVPAAVSFVSDRAETMVLTSAGRVCWLPLVSCCRPAAKAWACCNNASLHMQGEQLHLSKRGVTHAWLPVQQLEDIPPAVVAAIRDDAAQSESTAGGVTMMFCRDVASADAMHHELQQVLSTQCEMLHLACGCSTCLSQRSGIRAQEQRPHAIAVYAFVLQLCSTGKSLCCFCQHTIRCKQVSCGWQILSM
jgi:hypothetical protein